jgi:uncharacterized protein with PIN domain
MPTPREELKARLMAEAEAAIEKLLAERVAPAQASLADIERVALLVGQQMEEAMASALAAESALELPPWPTCPKCGQKMLNKGRRGRRVVTRAGEVAVERTYYYCPTCHEGFFPPGSALGTDGQRL